ncbi:hypothetical protein GCM10023328_06560 [Modestobacter marinus]|uniref:Uncharacterized protein n=1 Tax=Modestobacter marinus TaxID=477641 RepID=A0A846LFH2_9ACTN|nr:hypothetical protein [Modestobacter marinus]NIH66923.1 hypothetical protein [Modestobacter marinus]GGL50377.1 hypothetical protein GCM10011589_03400 [Modestobacter marinus]
MDIADVLAAAQTPVYLEGRSNGDLEARVHTALTTAGHSTVLEAHPALDAGLETSILDALLNLAKATKPNHQQDFLDQYRYWALFRYLGALTAEPALRLSTAGRRIRGNQRRVLSEELGVGFSVLVAEHWINHLLGTAARHHVVDIDVAIGKRTLQKWGANKRVSQSGGKRADYVMISQDPRDLQRLRILMLESKGTRSDSHSVRQLATAGQQLLGVELDERIPRGLAVSTVMDGEYLYYNALKLKRDARNPSRNAARSTLTYTPPEALHEGEAGLEITIDAERLDNRADVELGAEDGVAEDAAANAIRASWANLADFGNSAAAFRRWAPDDLLARKTRRADDLPSRETREIAGGVGLIGVSTDISLPGGRIEIFLGVTEELDEALLHGNAAAVLHAQGESLRIDRTQRPQDSHRAWSVSSDGAALLIAAR